MDFIAAIVSIEALGDWSFTKFIQEGRKHPIYKAIGYLSYIAVLEFFQTAIENKGLSWANSAWDGWSNLATGAVALFIFGEKPSMKQLMGMILISLGLFLLGTDGIQSYTNKK
jgi:multidrug transporter EmrE-like cation transporter